MKKTLTLKKTVDREQESDCSEIISKQRRYININLEYRTAKQDIPSGYCVYNSDSGLYISYASERTTVCSGVVLSDVHTGERIGYAVNGIIQNKKYQFVPPYGRPVWVSNTGMPTDNPPALGYLQPIGITIDADTFFLHPCSKLGVSPECTIPLKGGEFTIKTTLDWTSIKKLREQTKACNIHVTVYKNGRYVLSQIGDDATSEYDRPTIISYSNLVSSP
jgi:hypothetical protein